MTLSVQFVPQTLSVSVSPTQVGIAVGNPITRDFVERDPYTGEYTVTPGDSPVVLETKDLRMTDNVTVGAVPSNYGRIGWNGAVLTVS